jgi:hypothetical protein
MSSPPNLAARLTSLDFSFFVLRRGLTRFWSHAGACLQDFRSSFAEHRPNGTEFNETRSRLSFLGQGHLPAAVTCLPSKEALNNAYFELRERIDQIVTQAEQQGSLAVAIAGLNSIRHTLDSLMRLAGYDRPIGSQVNVAVQTNVNFDLTQIAERVLKRFDHEPELKARIARALLEVNDEQSE